MKVNKYHLAIVLLLILVLSSFKPSHINLESQSTKNITSNLQVLHTKYDYINIFLTNLMAGIVLSVVGFFTGGIITLLILLWNFILLWIIYASVVSSHQNINIILYYSKHLPIEIYAFALFSIIGFRGFNFYKKLIGSNELGIKLFPNIKELLIPTFLLFLSSLIEVL
ncbi:hypothetical protein [Polaribacter cellanae]|uniref:Stage II sporulation protein M n=1 Tax=Polaribacter cellanae TaxID=2818493 RepID=A0A975H6E4_9FLAO|nr:hypothetical protein [Polaribacter cellanae]QTE22381.1 hypothetical protein J3359_16500 [Polaribacter cellanae]